MEFSISLPLDADGFLRRECPSCERQFKWFPGGTDEKPDDFVDPPVYHCPYCGRPAPADAWWTGEQLEFAEASLAGPATDEIEYMLGDAFKSLQGGPLGITVDVESDVPEPPAPLVEPDDMLGVQAPCHPWEPVKVDETWGDEIHCLICGERFAY